MEDVRLKLKQLDPKGVQARTCRMLKGRTYVNPVSMIKCSVLRNIYKKVFLTVF